MYFKREIEDLFVKYLDNIVFKLLNGKNNVKPINFRRAQDKHEIDFIIDKQIAIEVKYRAKSIKQSKYKWFRDIYKDIPLLYVRL